jgi:hypothetical protein
LFVLAVSDIEKIESLDVVLTDSPQAIPTITTRFSYDNLPDSADENETETENSKAGTSAAEIEESPSSVDRSNEIPIIEVPPAITVVIPEVMDTEEISDGEVFPSDDEDMAEPGISANSTYKSAAL